MTVFIQKGGKPLSARQATERGLRMFEWGKPGFERETGLFVSQTQKPGFEPAAQVYQEYADGWLDDNLVNAANNLFNHQLAAYLKHKAILDTPFDDGSREAYTSEEIIGYKGLDAVPIYREYEAVPAIPMTETLSVLNEETGEVEDIKVEHPLRKADREAREFAALIIAYTPQEVIDWVEAG